MSFKDIAEEVGQENHHDEPELPAGTHLPPALKPGGRAFSKLPQTPVARVPLAELIGNREAPDFQRPKDVTPEERVYWKQRRTPRSSQLRSSQYTPAHSTMRRAKRARSSSPIPVPFETGLDSAAENDALDLQALQKSLKTPQADPVLELWNKYSMNKDTSQAPQLLPFTQLVTSSPRVTANGSPIIGGSGLRRSLSCGIEWPMSKAKRRKVTKPDIFRDNGAPAEIGLQDAQRTSKLSRVSLLVERIQESFMNPQGKENGVSGPSSSSPIPRRRSTRIDTSVSPLRDKATLRRAASLHESVPHQTEPAPATETHLRLSDSSSDFGEIDLDNVDLSLFDGSNPLPQAQVEDTADVGLAVQEEEEQETVEQCQEFPSPKRQSQFQTIAAADSDDFDDDGDEDLNAADLEEVMAEYDDHGSGRVEQARESLIEETTSHIESKPLSRAAYESDYGDQEFNNDDDEDEFGDISVLDFDIAAAQMVSNESRSIPDDDDDGGTMAGSVSHVCRNQKASLLN